MEKIPKLINWEKVGVYIAVITIIVMVASKINDLSERISKLEGKLEILIDHVKKPSKD